MIPTLCKVFSIARGRFGPRNGGLWIAIGSMAARVVSRGVGAMQVQIKNGIVVIGLIGGFGLAGCSSSGGTGANVPFSVPSSTPASAPTTTTSGAPPEAGQSQPSQNPNIEIWLLADGTKVKIDHSRQVARISLQYKALQLRPNMIYANIALITQTGKSLQEDCDRQRDFLSDVISSDSNAKMSEFLDTSGRYLSLAGGMMSLRVDIERDKEELRHRLDAAHLNYPMITEDLELRVSIWPKLPLRGVARDISHSDKKLLRALALSLMGGDPVEVTLGEFCDLISPETQFENESREIVRINFSPSSGRLDSTK